MSAISPIAANPPYALDVSQPALPIGAGKAHDIDAVTRDFEAVFLTQMLSAMFEGDDVNSFFGGGAIGDIYKSYFLNEYGKAMAKAGGIGIAASVKQELLKLQEVA